MNYILSGFLILALYMLVKEVRSLIKNEREYKQLKQKQ
jgi:hypothetical protein